MGYKIPVLVILASRPQHSRLLEKGHSIMEPLRELSRKLQSGNWRKGWELLLLGAQIHLAEPL
jgi:hypothetical protein